MNEEQERNRRWQESLELLGLPPGSAPPIPERKPPAADRPAPRREPTEVSPAPARITEERAERSMSPPESAWQADEPEPPAQAPAPAGEVPPELTNAVEDRAPRPPETEEEKEERRGRRRRGRRGRRGRDGEPEAAGETGPAPRTTQPGAEEENRQRGRRRSKERKVPSDEDRRDEPAHGVETDEMEDLASGWNIPPWNELIDNLYRP